MERLLLIRNALIHILKITEHLLCATYGVLRPKKKKKKNGVVIPSLKELLTGMGWALGAGVHSFLAPREFTEKTSVCCTFSGAISITISIMLWVSKVSITVPSA